MLGQNIPLTMEELAAREVKRQKAIELQEAIKQQVNNQIIYLIHQLYVYYTFVVKRKAVKKNRRNGKEKTG